MGRPSGCNCLCPGVTTTSTTSTTTSTTTVQPQYFCWQRIYEPFDYFCGTRSEASGGIWVNRGGPYGTNECDYNCPPLTTTVEPIPGRCCYVDDLGQSGCIDNVTQSYCSGIWGVSPVSWTPGAFCPCDSTTTTTCEPFGCCEECIDGYISSYISIQSACSGTWTPNGSSCNPPDCSANNGQPCENTTTTTTPAPLYRCCACCPTAIDVVVEKCEDCPEGTICQPINMACGFCAPCTSTTLPPTTTTTTTTVTTPGPTTTTTTTLGPTTTTTTTTTTTLPPTTTTTTTTETSGAPTFDPGGGL